MLQKILLGCLFLLFIFSCGKEKETDIIVNIDDDFYVEMFEDISNGDRRFQIDISTINEQTCLNYEIEYQLRFNESENAIDLSLNDLVEPEDCLEGLSFTSISVPFGTTLGYGYYEFTINLKDAVSNTGYLRVSADRYELEMDSDDGIVIPHEVLYRIPENTIWGYVAYDESEDLNAATSFIEDLKALGTIFEVENNSLYKAGYYGYFSLDEEKDLLPVGEINNNYVQPFIFQHDSENLADISNVMNDNCQNNQDLSIKIYDDKGVELFCN